MWILSQFNYTLKALTGQPFWATRSCFYLGLSATAPLSFSKGVRLGLPLVIPSLSRNLPPLHTAIKRKGILRLQRLRRFRSGWQWSTYRSEKDGGFFVASLLWMTGKKTLLWMTAGSPSRTPLQVNFQLSTINSQLSTDHWLLINSIYQKILHPDMCRHSAGFRGTRYSRRA